jgi:hypothetical protein
MKDEEILMNLAEFAREEERDRKSSPWVLLTAGELSADEIKALEARAEGDAEAALALAAHRPLDEAARSRIADRLVKMTAASKSTATPAAPAEGRSNVRQLTPRRSVTWMAPLALAAGLFVWFAVGHTNTSQPLPEYAMVVKGGDQVMRGAAEVTGKLTAGAADSRFEIVARPSTRIGGKVEAKAFALRGGSLEALDATVDVSDEGAVRIVGAGGALKDASEVRVVVARPERYSKESGVELAKNAGKSINGVVVLSIPVK